MSNKVINNIFDADTQVIVNPVNLVGVMGAGLAKEMKEKYPSMFESYKSVCDRKLFKEGQLQLYKHGDKWILNFPTKNHWKDASDLVLIEKGLENFVRTYKERGITSITFPKLGCGLGGLDWESQVAPLMHQYLDNLPIRIEVCGEHFQKREHENQDIVHEHSNQSIQMNLFEYFKDNDTFTIAEANEAVLHHYNRDVKIPSIRARIYEGIDKGLFKRVAKGVYTVTKNDSTCMVVNGDGRDLSFIKDKSIDCIITDHPYKLDKSQKGGNRHIANEYDTFQYNIDDMKEKQRVLKEGGFLVEMLPERNLDNLEYLNDVINLAGAVGLQFYAVVPWKKGDFIINQGRKSKNTEDIYFFTNGKARNLRPDAKKNKAYNESHTVVKFQEHIPGSVTVSYNDMERMPSSKQTEIPAVDVNIQISVLNNDKEKAEALLEEAWYNAVQYGFESSPLDKDNGGLYTLEELFDMPVQEYILKYIEEKGLSFDDLDKGPVEFFMSGAKGMLPTVFDVHPPSSKNKIHQSEKPVELYKKILEYTTLPGELVLDQFAGAGGLGKAALNTGRESILIEKDHVMCHKMVLSLKEYGEVTDITDQILNQLNDFNEEEPLKANQDELDFPTVSPLDEMIIKAKNRTTTKFKNNDSNIIEHSIG